ncbi:Ger(x)C family spore germination protein [Pontibacillus litoralis]|uniref:Spore germination protein KC n=1 Tax=Pontibacillus litoralis JSM 072002 TaxID=1385512 RepID=A0A0A5FZA6_9BACI|nr:Ger(x)C family spore germination protein [Pontibacillus litoralis]KGX85129.1 hypothetical protein N784_10100 [Pontibacillus litoralis JSM 072002]
MKRCILLFHLLLSIALLTGCWSSRELNELGIASAVGIDKVDDGYQVTVQLINPSEVASQSRTTQLAVFTYSATGKTIFEALRRMTTEAPRKLYLSHIRMIIFGQEIAAEGIHRSLDFFIRDHELRTDFFMVVAEGSKAYELLNIVTPVEYIGANKMFSSLETASQSWAPTKAVSIDEFVTEMESDGSNPVLSGIEIKGDKEQGDNLENVEQIDPKAKIELKNLVVFKGDKMKGKLSETESKGYNYIKDNVSNTIATQVCSTEGGSIKEFVREKESDAEQFISEEITSSKTKVKGSVVGNKPKINISVETKANIGDVECTIDLSKIETLKQVEDLLAADIKDAMEQSIQRAKELESDIFGFGEAIYRSNPKQWEKWKKNWDEEYFQDLAISIDVKVNIHRTGTITKPLKGGE